MRTTLLAILLAMFCCSMPLFAQEEGSIEWREIPLGCDETECEVFYYYNVVLCNIMQSVIREYGDIPYFSLIANRLNAERHVVTVFEMFSFTFPTACWIPEFESKTMRKFPTFFSVEEFGWDNTDKVAQEDDNVEWGNMPCKGAEGVECEEAFYYYNCDIVRSIFLQYKDMPYYSSIANKLNAGRSVLTVSDVSHSFFPPACWTPAFESEFMGEVPTSFHFEGKEVGLIDELVMLAGSWEYTYSGIAAVSIIDSPWECAREQGEEIFSTNRYEYWRIRPPCTIVFVIVDFVPSDWSITLEKVRD